MKKSEVKKRIQEGFLELPPDLFESIQDAAKQEHLIFEKTELKTTLSKSLEFKAKSKKDSRRQKIFRYAVSFCACLAVFFLCLFQIQKPGENDRYLIVDINPSIQMVFDDSYKIEKLIGLNRDGKKIVEQLDIKPEETIFYVLDVILQESAAESYLKKDGGILVTLCLPDEKQCEELETKLGQNIDKTLKQTDLSDVTAVFWKSEQTDLQSGRELLETKLAEEYGIDIQKVRQMSMMELISYCRENTSYSFQFSPESERQWKLSTESKENETKKTKRQMTKPDIESVQPKPDAQSEPESVQENKQEDNFNLPVQKNIELQSEQPPAMQPDITQEEPAPAMVQPEPDSIQNEQPLVEPSEEPKQETEEKKEKETNGSRKKKQKQKKKHKDKKNEKDDKKNNQENEGGKNKNKDKQNGNNKKEKEENGKDENQKKEEKKNESSKKEENVNKNQGNKKINHNDTGRNFKNCSHLFQKNPL